MMQPITIRCFHYSAEQQKASELEIPIKLSDCELRPIMFLNINGITSSREETGIYGVVMSNGDEFITEHSYNELRTIIKNHLAIKTEL